MERLIDGLAEPLQDAIQTDWRVQSVAYGDDVDGVRLESDDGRVVHADAVIITAALGLLKTGELAFSPALPVAKQATIARSAMGQYMKVLVQFSHVFWERDTKFFGQLRCGGSSSGTAALDDDADSLSFPLLFNYYYAKRAPILEGVLIGATAAQASARFSDDAIVAAFFRQLQGTYGVDIPEPVAHFITRCVLLCTLDAKSVVWSDGGSLGVSECAGGTRIRGLAGRTAASQSTARRATPRRCASRLARRCSSQARRRSTSTKAHSKRRISRVGQRKTSWSLSHILPY